MEPQCQESVEWEVSGRAAGAVGSRQGWARMGGAAVGVVLRDAPEDQ